MKNCFALCVLVFSSVFGNKPLLSDYKRNVYSQWGEDGIIEKIFSVMGTTSKIAVEFGASDGFAFSNTANLWVSDPSWKAYLIESNATSFQQLVSNVAPYPCIPIHRAVGVSSLDSLETILHEYKVGPSIDILSIDVDGNDYHIFKSLTTCRPRLIICEYNPTIPAHMDVYPTKGDNYMGCSVAALQRVAKSKGYGLIAITETNCFFVREEELPLFEGFELEQEKICLNKFIRYVITDYSGNYFLIAGKDFQEPYGLHHPSHQAIDGEIIQLPFTK